MNSRDIIQVVASYLSIEESSYPAVLSNRQFKIDSMCIFHCLFLEILLYIAYGKTNVN